MQLIVVLDYKNNEIAKNLKLLKCIADCRVKAFDIIQSDIVENQYIRKQQQIVIHSCALIIIRPAEFKGIDTDLLSCIFYTGSDNFNIALQVFLQAFIIKSVIKVSKAGKRMHRIKCINIACRKVCDFGFQKGIVSANILILAQWGPSLLRFNKKGPRSRVSLSRESLRILVLFQ